MIEENSYVLFIKKLPNTYNVSDLQDSLSKFLKEDFKIKRGKKKGKNKKSSYAIISLSSKDEKLSLLGSKIVFNGTTLRFEDYKSPEQLFYQASNMLQRRIYINNFPPDVTRDTVLQQFSNYGEIETLFLKKQLAQVGEPGEGRSLIKSFITFKDHDDVKRCLDDLPILYDGRELEIYQITKPERRISKLKGKQSKGHGQHQNYGNRRYGHKKAKGDPGFGKNGQYYRKREREHINSKGGNTNPPLNKTNKRRDDRRIAPKLSESNFKYKARTRRLQEQTQPRPGRRGKVGRFAILPFKRRAAEFYDWMGTEINEYISLLNLVPRSAGMPHYGERRWSNDFEGYDHSYANIRFNKSGI